MTDTFYTQQQVGHISGISSNTIQGWSRDGVIAVASPLETGRGRPRLYSRADIIHIAIIEALSRRAFNRSLIKALSRYLESNPDEKAHWLDPLKVPSNTLVVLEMNDEGWRLRQDTRQDETVDGKTLHTPRYSLNEMIGTSEALVIINISAIMDRLRERL